MKRQWTTPGRRRIIVVSTFSGMDLLLLGCVKAGLLPGYAVERNFWASLMHQANFKHTDGTPVMEFINISPEEYTFKKNHKDEKGKNDMEDEVGNIDGQNVRTKLIQEVNGHDIRAGIEARYGKDVIIVYCGGPPCQSYTKLSTKNHLGTGIRNLLVFEYLRVLDELCPDIALMEQVTDFGSPKFKQIYDDFFSQAAKLPYRIATQEMCSLHYSGNQSRERLVVQFVHMSLNADPVFPVADVVNVKRVKDFLDIDYFFSGHYTDSIKTKNHFMCTVTSGSPLWFSKNGKKYPPPVDDLLLCMDVKKGQYIIPEGIPQDQIKLAIGNGVCVSLAYALAKNIIENILRLKPDGDGYFVPIADDIDPLPNNDGSGDTNDILISDNIAIVDENNVPSETTKEQLLSIDGSDATKNLGQAEVLPIKVSAPAISQLVINQEKYLKQDVEKIQIKIPDGLIHIKSTNSKKIISSQQLKDMEFSTLKFHGKFNTLFGDPSINFFCVIHGLPGHGKSTFAIQLAKYLADNFGSVIYISGEEGFSMTFKNKLVMNNVNSKQLFVADLRTFDDIIRAIPVDSYQFIFIDSLDNMDIDADKMKALRLKYKNVAIISICQSTKNGVARGSNELIHDSDLVVIIENGIATTTKNRFKEKGMTYEVFEEITLATSQETK